MKVQTVTDIRHRSQLLADAPARIQSSGVRQVTMVVKHIEQGKSILITVGRDEFDAIRKAFDDADSLMDLMNVGRTNTDKPEGSLV